MHSFTSVAFDDEKGELVVLDQTLLPNEIAYIRLSRIEEVWEAIRNLRVRGAPAIGIAAAYGVYLAVRNSAKNSSSGALISIDTVMAVFENAKQYLASARPTAVNLFWALERMERRLSAEYDTFALSAKNRNATKIPSNSNEAIEALLDALRREAQAIRDEDAKMCHDIGEHGLTLLERGWGILTHCNAGALATAEFGTALAPIYLGQERGYAFKVFADETRPLLQGARLTTWELMQAGVDTTLICDNMAASVMKKGLVQAVLVGCDRVAANGDTANKIGTLGVAILAKHYGIPFYVLGPSSSIDLSCPTGAQIEIEERSGEEITSKWYARPMAPKGVSTYNPAFDVTDNELITAIITEKGVARPPFVSSLRGLLG